jgi:hypothetical protein
MKFPIFLIPVLLSSEFALCTAAGANVANATTPPDKFRSSASAARIPGTPDSSGIESSTPTADLFVGAASYTIPLRLPQGRNSMAPQLDLVYRSDAGNGALGVGWSVEFDSGGYPLDSGSSYRLWFGFGLR